MESCLIGIGDGVKYRIIKEKLHSEDVGEYTAYGLEMYAKSGACYRISDKTVSYFKIRDLCRKCNKLNVSPINIYEIIDDFIG